MRRVVDECCDGQVSSTHHRYLNYLVSGDTIQPGNALMPSTGIGNPEVLRNAGIDTVVDLPAVGENLQVSCQPSGVVVHKLE